MLVTATHGVHTKKEWVLARIWKVFETLLLYRCKTDQLLIVQQLAKESEEFQKRCEEERDEFKNLFKKDSEAMQKRVIETESKFVEMNETVVNAQQAEFRAR